MTADRSETTRTLVARHPRQYLKYAVVSLAGATLYWAFFVAPTHSVAPIIGWLGVGVCGLACITFVVLLVTPPTLDLDDDGFVMKNRFHTWRYAWEDIGPFVVAPWNVGGHWRDAVYVDFAGPGHSGALRGIRRFNRRLTGHDFAIVETYGCEIHEFAALMNASRDRVQTTPSSGS
jgi:hypothetical protein